MGRAGRGSSSPALQRGARPPIFCWRMGRTGATHSGSRSGRRRGRRSCRGRRSWPGPPPPSARTPPPRPTGPSRVHLHIPRRPCPHREGAGLGKGRTADGSGLVPGAVKVGEEGLVVWEAGGLGEVPAVLACDVEGLMWRGGGGRRRGGRKGGERRRQQERRQRMASKESGKRQGREGAWTHITHSTFASVKPEQPPTQMCLYFVGSNDVLLAKSSGAPP